MHLRTVVLFCFHYKCRHQSFIPTASLSCLCTYTFIHRIHISPPSRGFVPSCSVSNINQVCSLPRVPAIVIIRHSQWAALQEGSHDHSGIGSAVNRVLRLLGMCCYYTSKRAFLVWSHRASFETVPPLFSPPAIPSPQPLLPPYAALLSSSKTFTLAH